jgi:hypothetical protein
MMNKNNCRNLTRTRTTTTTRRRRRRRRTIARRSMHNNCKETMNHEQAP